MRLTQAPSPLQYILLRNKLLALIPLAQLEGSIFADAETDFYKEFYYFYNLARETIES
jgi:hypothetical protein